MEHFNDSATDPEAILSTMPAVKIRDTSREVGCFTVYIKNAWRYLPYTFSRRQAVPESDRSTVMMMQSKDPFLDSGAKFSPDQQYRYSLWRRWAPNTPYALFIGLNPSTADAQEDDPTIRRCKRFAADWGYGALYMANLFAIRATKPVDMLAHPDPTGIDNDTHLQQLAHDAGVIVCAWGTNGSHLGRDAEVKSLLTAYELKCLGTTKDGYPRHPLYLKADRPLQAFDR